MSIELKIKGLTLAQEARIIRNYERKLRKMKPVVVTLKRKEGRDETGAVYPREKVIARPGKPDAWKRWGQDKVRSLQDHRRGVVRKVARHTHLARMFLKGTPYYSVEQYVHASNALTPNDWEAIFKMVQRYARYGTRPDEFANYQDVAQKFEEWKQPKLGPTLLQILRAN